MNSLSIIAICVSVLLQVYCDTTTNKFKTINGHLVDVVDNCDPKDFNSCGDGRCCVQESLAYIPEFQGPKPTYRIRCRDLTQRGRFCFNTPGYTELCPCEKGLKCTWENPGIKSFGKCL